MTVADITGTAESVPDDGSDSLPLLSSIHRELEFTAGIYRLDAKSAHSDMLSAPAGGAAAKVEGLHVMNMKCITHSYLVFFFSMTGVFQRRHYTAGPRRAHLRLCPSHHDASRAITYI